MKLLTINIGNLSYAKYSIPFIKKLCDTNDIEFVCLNEDIKQNSYKIHPSWLKLFSHDLYEDDFIIWWDLDLIPCRMYNLREYFDVTKLNFSYDSSYIADNFVFNGKFKYNCGLAGVPKSYSEQLKNIYFKNGDNATYPSYEQYYVNDWIYDNNIEINLLPEKLNCMKRHITVFPEDTLNMHYSHHERHRLIQEHYNKYKDILND